MLRAAIIAVLIAAAAPATADNAATATVGFDSGSVSCGSANRGALAAAARLAPEGETWAKPGPWRRRGLHYGTDELVGVIQRAARRVADEYPGSILGVADLSREAGGAVAGHASHQSGRDADILYYAIDKRGGYLPPDDHMPVYTITGKAYYSEAPSWKSRISERWFDLARNWALVEALIDDPEARVVAIFVSGAIERWLLDYAQATGESRRTIQRAAFILTAPKNVRAHRDHMHIRVGCTAADVDAGRCSDENAPSLGRGRRWMAEVRCN